jgi:phosphoglycerate dehydrogenase-like enzyme
MPRSAPPQLAIDAELHSVFGEHLAPYAVLHVIETSDDLRRLAAPTLRGMILRTEQRVDPALCARFPELELIATASAGTDHIDAPPGVRVLDAGGGNADGVADWVIMALLGRFGLDGERPRVGLLGCGECGGRVARRLTALGFPVILHDPPRARRDPSFTSAPLEALYAAEVLSLHVPLNPRGAQDETEGWVDTERIAGWRRPLHLLNAARGPVVDEAAARAALGDGSLASWSADVLVDEASPDPRLIAALARCTPHIAGRSDDGRRSLQQRCLAGIAGAFALPVEPLPDLAPLTLPCPGPGKLWPFLETLSGFPGAEARLREAPSTFKALRHAHRRRDLRALRIAGGDNGSRATLERIGLGLGAPGTKP